MNTEDDEFERLGREQKMRGVPDAIHHTDTSETLQYIQGWNDCRAEMLAEQPAQQEPVAGLLVGQDSDGRYVSIAAKAHADTLPLGEYKLYTSPPAQRTWVGLTDEEKRQIFEREDYQGWLDYINAIEAKLKEKNNG